MNGAVILVIGALIIGGSFVLLTGFQKQKSRHRKKTNIIHNYSDRKVGLPVSNYKDKPSP